MKEKEERGRRVEEAEKEGEEEREKDALFSVSRPPNSQAGLSHFHFLKLHSLLSIFSHIYQNHSDNALKCS